MHVTKEHGCCHRIAAFLALIVLLAVPCRAQVSLSEAVHLALQNSSRVKAAQNDAKKAQAGLDVAKDIFIPSVVTTGGAGDTYGITLTVPTIFTVAAQSLIYSDQQRFYLRAAHDDLLAAGLALTEARDQVEEDTAVTYVSLAEAEASLSALAEQLGFASKLVAIVQDRVHGGLDSPIELTKARRGAIQIRLARMQMEDTISSLRGHLAELTGLASDQVAVAPETVPALPDPASSEDAPSADWAQSPGLLAAEANADARMQRARGDARYTWRPIITFGAQYGRVSPINDVSQFYNLHGNYNTANVGFQIELPILDKVRKAAAKVAFADVARAQIDLGNLHAQIAEDRRRLQRSIPELALKSQLAELDLSIAQDDLNATIIRMHAANSAIPATPKEEQDARIQERQKYLDYLDARLQLSKSEIYYLRQSGQLDSWAQSVPIPAGSSGAVRLPKIQP